MANDQQVAVLQPPRLAYHEAINERFGIDRASWKALVEAVWPSAKTTDGVVLALSYCRARKLDPFKRTVHIVPIYDARKGVEVESVWPGIAEHRTTAMRTKSYAGMDTPAFGPMITRRFEGKVRVGRGDNAATKDEVADVSFPEWCQITVYRMVQGQRVPFPGPKVLWLEFYMRRSRFVELPNEQWAKRPTQMLEKCAEAGALRRAFPEELGDDWTIEEAGSFLGPDGARHVDAEVTTAPPEPRRNDSENATVPLGSAEFPDRLVVETGPVAATAAPASPPVSPPTSPTTSAKAESEPTDGGPVAADARHSPPEGQSPPDLSMPLEHWRVGEDVLGQENVIARLVKLVGLVETLADLDAIESENAERLAKITGVRRSNLNNTLRAKRESLT